MKKKLIATLLAMAMLLSFATIGAAASEAPDLQAQGRAMLEETFAVFETGQFTLRGRSQTPNDSRPYPITLVIDGDRMAVEAPSSIRFWSDRGVNRFQAFAMRAVFGNRLRVFLSPEQSAVVFQNRRAFISFDGILEDDDDLFSWIGGFGGVREIPAQLSVAEVTINRRTYLRVTFEEYGATWTYDYHNGQLRRLVATSWAGTVLIEVDYFSGTVDESLFSTRWMIGIPLNWIF